ncbi:MAG TPA: hypothetical protein VGQ85_06785 [Candidatus Limnocylindrales bacterium]|nr:hypothetical protein [Candidatus Limnocylindrales bacterium]
MTDHVEPAPKPGRTCAWCSAPAAAEATHCPACGAALAQRESLGGVVIPGVTDVHPALVALDAQPIRMRGPSPTQGLASGAMMAAVVGGPAGLIAIGGIVAVAAVEYLGDRNPDGTGPLDLESVGKLSGTAQMVLERIEREGEPEAAPEPESLPNSPPT